jgi:glyoxylase-like metal-dependent hydrolase (beta-lactamase superfamily II)
LVPGIRAVAAPGHTPGHTVFVVESHGANVSFPGIGQLRPDGKGYRWLPANYTANNPAPAK